jgi:hypothetical protein
MQNCSPFDRSPNARIAALQDSERIVSRASGIGSEWHRQRLASTASAAPLSPLSDLVQANHGSASVGPVFNGHRLVPHGFLSLSMDLRECADAFDIALHIYAWHLRR